jgi:hypothetical protein
LRTLSQWSLENVTIFDLALAYMAMTKGVPLPYVVTILYTFGIISVFSLSGGGVRQRGEVINLRWQFRCGLPRSVVHSLYA